LAGQNCAVAHFVSTLAPLFDENAANELASIVRMLFPSSIDANAGFDGHRRKRKRPPHWAQLRERF
jgi:hypothetical protein